MEKKITLNGKEYTMRASALLPRLYRYHFGHDFIQDIAKLQKSYNDVVKDLQTEDESEKKIAQLSVTDLTTFENIAWLMLKQGGEDVGESPDEWLDSLDGVFSVFEVLPAMLSLWQVNTATTSKPKKK